MGSLGRESESLWLPRSRLSVSRDPGETGPLRSYVHERGLKIRRGRTIEGELGRTPSETPSVRNVEGKGSWMVGLGVTSPVQVPRNAETESIRSMDPVLTGSLSRDGLGWRSVSGRLRSGTPLRPHDRDWRGRRRGPPEVALHQGQLRGTVVIVVVNNPYL